MITTDGHAEAIHVESLPEDVRRNGAAGDKKKKASAQ